jgi:hypothetical protein
MRGEAGERADARDVREAAHGLANMSGADALEAAVTGGRAMVGRSGRARRRRGNLRRWASHWAWPRPSTRTLLGLPGRSVCGDALAAVGEAA